MSMICFHCLLKCTFAAESWFLASLYSLCVGYTKGKWNYFDTIFENIRSEDLNRDIIPIKLWRYGKWKTVDIESCLPTRKGERCFLYSTDANVFWCALIEKAYAM